MTEPSSSYHGLATLFEPSYTVRCVGNLIDMNYSGAVLLTNDFYRRRVGGIPRNCLLLAANFDPAHLGGVPVEDRVVVLLRAQGPAPLFQDQIKRDALVQYHESRTEVSASGLLEGMGKYTRSQLEVSGLDCKILGSFYEDERGRLAFGADVEDFSALPQLQCYKPRGEALHQVVGYCNPARLASAREDVISMGFSSAPRPFVFGHLRYTSTDRMQTADGTAVPISFEVVDLLGKRCGVFGMTRTGKSNLIKTLVSAISMETMRVGGKVGQLVLDLNGEYANVNQQDAGSLSQVFEDNVVRYSTRASVPGVRDIRPNYYRSYDIGLAVLQEAVRHQTMGSDLRAFLGLELPETPPDVPSEFHRWQVKVAAYKCLLNASQFELSPADNVVKFSVGKSVIAQATRCLWEEAEELAEDDCLEFWQGHYPGSPEEGISLDSACSILKALREADTKLRADARSRGVGLCSSSSAEKGWFDDAVLSMLNLIVGRTQSGGVISGTKIFASHRAGHSKAGLSNPSRAIYDDLNDGRLVIVDLSVSSPHECENLLGRIAAGIFQSSLNLFTQGKRPPAILVYVEEAHNLIGKGAKPNDPWPRLAKEGAKVGMGLIYATQEPSSIQTNILSNTENIMSSHLNNDEEIKTLSKYYDFGDFAESLKTSQDVGFIRLKRLSAPFVIPMHALRFSPQELKQRYAEITRPAEFQPVKPRGRHAVQG